MELVALRKESVDRNIKGRLKFGGCQKSLSARRAWIEIVNYEDGHKLQWRSLSARRAWIEIAKNIVELTSSWGRSPQGERG